MRKTLGLAIATGTMIATGAAAQDGGATRLEFGFASNLRADDNWRMEDPSPGNSFQFSNDLSFGLTTETRSASFSLNLGTEIHSTNIAGDPSVTGVANPYANVQFQQAGPGTSLTLNAGISIADRDIDLSLDDGSATNSNVGGTYSFGEDALFGGSVSASFAQTDYTGTADDDTNTRNVSASLRFEPSPGLTVSPSARQTRYEEESGPSNIT